MPITKTDLTDLINFQIHGRGTDDWFRPNLPPGQQNKKYQIRVCPPWEGSTVPFHKTDIHYFNFTGDDGEELLSGVCPRVMGCPCPACARFWKLRNIIEQDAKSALNDLGPDTKFYCNMVDRGESSPRVKVWGMSFKVGSDIVGQHQVYADEGRDLTDPVKGYDFIISLEKRGNRFNYGSAARVPKASKIGVKGWEDQLHDCVAMAHQRELSTEDVLAVLPKVLGIFYDDIEEMYERSKGNPGRESRGEQRTPEDMELRDLSAMPVVQLRRILKERGEPVSGNKTALVRRINKSQELEGLGERV